MTFKADLKTRKISMFQGESGSFGTRHWQDTDKTIPRDLTGLTIKLLVARSTSPSHVVKLCNEHTIYDAENTPTVVPAHGIKVEDNVITYAFIDDDTAGLKPGDHVYQVIATDGADFMEVLIAGDLELKARLK